MSEVTKLIEQFEAGDGRAIDELLPILYNELRHLANKQLANEAPGQSLQTSDLVHEAYLRLVGSNQEWRGRGHFLGAAAEAMRRILVERARRKSRVKHGGRLARVELPEEAPSAEPPADEVIMVSDLLDTLGKIHPLEAQIVKLNYFAGLSISEAGSALGISTTTAYRGWTFARAWLHEAIQGDNAERGSQEGEEQRTED